MSKQRQQTFYVLPEWIITQTGKSLIISGGADAKYEIELEVEEPSFFGLPASYKPFIRSELTDYDQRVLEELLTAEIVVPLLEKAQILKVAVIGDNANLIYVDTKSVLFVEAQKQHDIALIVRSSSTYGQLLNTLDYQTIATPHLFVDLAFHHTASIGPLVFPGETACIACLQGRISTRWDDTQPPLQPKIAIQNSALLYELIVSELQKISQGDTSLTNKTVSWNFQNRIVKENQLLKVPLCPICSHKQVDHSGALVLPWSK